MAIVRHEPGFSLIETLIATAIISSAFGVLAHLAVMATRANVAARFTSVAALVAADRVEVLASDLAVAPAAVPLSPADALTANTPGFAEFFDAAGGALGAGPPAPDGAALVCRWSVRPLPGASPAARLVHVVVLPWPRAAALGASVSRRVELARVVFVSRGP